MNSVVRVSAILGLAGALLIGGIVTSAQSNAPIAGVKVTAASLSQTEPTTTDARGFYSLVALAADTYTVSFQVSGYSAVSAQDCEPYLSW
ncbi:MAG TPA: carboxypeptidase-like regulatory domain-containing protein [Candidatus Baltobacteraceae bacterium]|nr:carboxypeptidase-like regulatory domain-containing protein [Candidatus Baltobacteraceae bacterium]